MKSKPYEEVEYPITLDGGNFYIYPEKAHLVLVSPKRAAPLGNGSENVQLNVKFYDKKNAEALKKEEHRTAVKRLKEQGIS